MFYEKIKFKINREIRVYISKVIKVNNQEYGGQKFII